jgi:hypothetical protein
MNKEIKRMEETCSLEQVKHIARVRGLEVNGTKHDIVGRLLSVVPQTVKKPSKYLGGWQPGDFAIYSDFGLRSLYIVRVLEWPEGKGDRFVETTVGEHISFSMPHDRSMGTVRAVVVDTTLVDWDFNWKQDISEHQREGTIHYYHYTNLYHDISELIGKEERYMSLERVRIAYDLRKHPGWIILAAYGLRK